LRLLLHIVFIASYVTAFWQYFEWAFKLYQNGHILSPIWSGTLGYPIPHHGYVGFLGALMAYFGLSFNDFKKFVLKVMR